MDRTMQDALKGKELAGANLLVLKDGAEVFYYEKGFSNVEAGNPIRRDTIFRLYSMSKPVTAAAVMILMERGLIDLFDPVSKYLPGFRAQTVDVAGKTEPVRREICLKDLLDMTSGLLYDGENRTGKETAALFETLKQRLLGEKPLTTVEAMNTLGGIPLAFHPGESWAYGTSADVLGAVVEVVSGKRFGAFLSNEIFTPLGMEDTGFFVPPEKRDRLATAYGVTEDKELEAFRGNHLGIINAMDREPAFESGGAGLVSTIDDYSKFAGMLLGQGSLGSRKILEPATAKYFTSPELTEKARGSFASWLGLSGHSYGNLMRVAVTPGAAGLLTSPGEYGWDGWLGCHFANFPTENMTLLMMMQKKDAGTWSLTRKLRNVLLAELL